MKNRILMFSFIFFAVFAWACGSNDTPKPTQTNTDFIVGNWKISGITIKTDKASYDIPGSPATPISAKFSDKGTYIFNQNGQDQTAKWKWLEASKKLEITHTDNTTTVFEITNSSTTEWTYVATQANLPLTNPNAEQETLLQFANLYLTASGVDFDKTMAEGKIIQVLFTMKPL